MVTPLTQKIVLEEFFHHKLKEALKIQDISISEEVQFYLIHIMIYFSKSENLFQKDENGQLEYRALALKLHDSIFATSHGEKYSHLKSLADTALYHAGVFYEGLYNQVVDVDYYINMGGSAYQSLANLSTGHRKSLADMFAEMSFNFAKLVELLNLCCEKEEELSDEDILKLLDRYMKTGSQKAKEKLEGHGILPETLAVNLPMQ
ncbi:hypothetical protein BVY03_01810 [bacterium K02(2017)]|nr:hypothetical protein BVY03_01810 [bacterium K02(2017)]